MLPRYPEQAIRAELPPLDTQHPPIWKFTSMPVTEPPVKKVIIAWDASCKSTTNSLIGNIKGEFQNRHAIINAAVRTSISKKYLPLFESFFKPAARRFSFLKKVS